ncbi:Inter-alpha-trypsin inhibitor heavy chain H2 [Saguinus oedipus]|uniref:Inter-alpha-trypsin inhibitor heavy chain H2 n=1 Tax=Saguinus oedipus TaxID=9490 RepID=A0ABQ9V842_SAGOE|nr:Inter-alpha-trypsin inhibitor heavy chain H2 [Saguinus oedipus]
MENFRTEVNVLPGAKVEFELHYQEAKWRKLGSYEHRIYLQPGRLAKHLEVDVWVVEPQGMRFLHVADTFEGHFDGVPVISKGQQKHGRLEALPAKPWLVLPIGNGPTDVAGMQNVPWAAPLPCVLKKGPRQTLTGKGLEAEAAHISFKPTVAQQRICPSCRETAVDGELVVLYDVSREEKAGELEVSADYLWFKLMPKSCSFLKKLPGIDQHAVLHIASTYPYPLLALSLLRVGALRGSPLASRAPGTGALCKDWCGVAWRGVEWSSVEQHGAEQSGMAWSGVAWSGVAWSGVAWRGVLWSGVE